MSDLPPTKESGNGLYGKYHGLRRSRDDSLVEGWYFVLRTNDPHALRALLAYADSVQFEDFALAKSLRKVVYDARQQPGLADASWER